MRKVGATQEDPVDVRIISATHQNLAALVEAGGSARTCIYRLNVIELKMPSLRECREDIAAIAAAILARLAAQAGAAAARLSAAALQELAAYDFPATCANWRTSWSARSRSPAASEIAPEDLRLRPLVAASEAPAGARRRRRRCRAAAARVSRPRRARGDPRRAGEDRLQPHRGGEAARHHLPHAALPHAAARHPRTGHAGWPVKLAATAGSPARGACRRRTATAGRRAPTISLLVLHSISLPRGRLRRRRDRAPVHQPAGPGGASSFADLAGLRVSSHFLIRRDGELVQFVPLQAARLARRRLALARARALQRFLRRHRARRHRRRPRSRPRSTNALRVADGTCKPSCRCATSRRTAMSRPAARPIPARASTGRASCRAWRAPA